MTFLLEKPLTSKNKQTNKQTNSDHHSKREGLELIRTRQKFAISRTTVMWPWTISDRALFWSSVPKGADSASLTPGRLKFMTAKLEGQIESPKVILLRSASWVVMQAIYHALKRWPSKIRHLGFLNFLQNHQSHQNCPKVIKVNKETIRKKNSEKKPTCQKVVAMKKIFPY